MFIPHVLYLFGTSLHWCKGRGLYMVTFSIGHLYLSEVWQGLWLRMDTAKNMLWWDWAMCSKYRHRTMFIVHAIETTYVIINWREWEYLLWPIRNFCISTSIWEFEMTFWVIRNCYMDEIISNLNQQWTLYWRMILDYMKILLPSLIYGGQTLAALY